MALNEPSPRLRGEGGAKRRVRGALLLLLLLTAATHAAERPDLVVVISID